VYTDARGAVAVGLEPITFAETLSYLQQSDVLEKHQVNGLYPT